MKTANGLVGILSSAPIGEIDIKIAEYLRAQSAQIDELKSQVEKLKAEAQEHRAFRALHNAKMKGDTQ